MRVEIEREVATKRTLVYVIRDGDPTWQWFPEVNGGPTWLQIEPDEKIRPSLKIDDEVWVALVPVLLGLPIEGAGAGMAAHLKDAQVVRDRLLALVENGFNACVPDGKLFGKDE